jgi:PAS domain S-box-containing protein
MSSALSDDGVRNLLSYDSKVDDRFRAIFNAVNDGIFISDPDTGQFVEINEAGCRMFGYDKTEIIGLGVDTLSSGVHPYTQDMAVELNEKARLGEPQIFEWRCKTKDGVLFWTEMSLRHSEFGHGPAVIAVIRDISERKRLDAEVVYSIEARDALIERDANTGKWREAQWPEAEFIVGNPPDLVEIVPEVVPNYPDRVLPKNLEAEAVLKERTLTKLYNARPQWLDDAHAELDHSVAAAYGWPEDISTDEALSKLLELNLKRAAE